MKKTDLSDPNYFHKVVDCQWACPAHTNVPEYIRLIAAGRYTDSYMLNWFSNVFPGVLGRTCDRPCEPACRRGRVEEKPVAICRLKRVAADLKDDISDRLPAIPAKKNGKRIALVGAGPASLTVARDLMPLGYHVVLFEKDPMGGGWPGWTIGCPCLKSDWSRCSTISTATRLSFAIKQHSQPVRRDLKP